MQRMTMSIDDGLSETFDKMVISRAYASRSEALRDIVRDAIEDWREEHSTTADCVASLSYVYDRRLRSLPQRLAELQHEHHDIVASSTTVRLDHYHSMECVMLKGKSDAVRALADTIRAQRGVRFGKLNLVAVQPGDDHDRGQAHHHHNHGHLSPIGS